MLVCKLVIVTERVQHCYSLLLCFVRSPDNVACLVCVLLCFREQARPSSLEIWQVSFCVGMRGW